MTQENLEKFKNTIAIDLIRLNNFLKNNQLVQSNAVASKLESILKEKLNIGCCPEKSPHWSTFKTILVIKNHIISGNTKEALKTLENINTKGE